MTKDKIANQFKVLQADIVSRLEIIDGTAMFKSDAWDRVEGGGGITKIIEKGSVIEKGGVAFSAVHGPVSEVMKSQLGMKGDSFFATGVSIVLHPINPHVPIIHMNIRYFELDSGEYWFGGGIDLTPHYIVEEQARHFHIGLKKICDKYSVHFYDSFKKGADDYFFIPHRNETRGIGGIFFDHQNDKTSGITKDNLFDFCIELGTEFPNLYNEQVIQGKNKPFTEDELNWRNLRRGRYVEFNLVNDRGTKFGLLSGGRTESILMSLPANATWEYNKQIEENSKENATLKLLKKGIQWV